MGVSDRKVEIFHKLDDKSSTWLWQSVPAGWTLFIQTFASQDKEGGGGVWVVLVVLAGIYTKSPFIQILIFSDKAVSQPKTNRYSYKNAFNPLIWLTI